MKFDFIIGNPPYQESSNNTSDKPIYDQFMEETYKIADKVELITPARFLFNAGKTPKKWNKKMLEDIHLKVLWYEEDSSKAFKNVDIKGGVAITYRDKNKIYNPILTYTKYPILNSILNKVQDIDKTSLSDIVFPQNKFNLEILYKNHPESISKIGSKGKEKRLTTSIFNTLDIFTSKPFNETDVKILGLINGKRVFKYLPKKFLDESHYLNKFKVIIPKSNGSGALGEVLSKPLIGTPNFGITQSFIAIGAFDNYSEAENLLKYIKTKFLRTLLSILKITQDNPKNVWKYIPQQDFTLESDIDWTKSISEIDKQLYKKYNFTNEEIKFIEDKVKEMN